MDFNLNDEKKGELINNGRQCTKEFLKEMDLLIINKKSGSKKKPDFFFLFFFPFDDG